MRKLNVNIPSSERGSFAPQNIDHNACVVALHASSTVSSTVQHAEDGTVTCSFLCTQHHFSAPKKRFLQGVNQDDQDWISPRSN
jgi:hypothetical protein